MSSDTIIKAIKQKLDEMVGKTFQYATHYHLIKKYDIESARNRVYIHTDKSDYDRTFDSFFDFIEMFKPVTDVDRPTLFIRQVDGDIISNLRDVLLDNITKIKEDKTYIPQAEAIKGNVDSIIDLAKTEIAYMVSFERIRKK